MPYDANDPKQVKQRRIAEKQRQLELDQFTQAIMDTRQGRRWMWDWLERLGPFQSPFNQNAMLMSNNVGRSDVGRELLDNITRVAPDQFILAMKEAQDERLANEYGRQPGTNRVNDVDELADSGPTGDDADRA